MSNSDLSALSAALESNRLTTAAGTTTPATTKMTGEVPLEQSLRRIQVKISLRNEEMVPAGIRGRSRPPEQRMDEHHAGLAMEIGRPDLAEVGRVREGRVDTGDHVVDNLQFVQIATLRRGFASNSFFLTEAYTYTKPNRLPGVPAHKAKPTYVIVLTFRRGEDPIDLGKGVTEAIRELANTTWQFCHVWSNPDHTVTVNVGGPMQNTRPKNAIVVRHRTLKNEPVTQSITESEE